MQHALSHSASLHWLLLAPWLAHVPPLPPHCCRAATDRVQFAGVLTSALSPSGVLAAVTAAELELAAGEVELTAGEATGLESDASSVTCDVTATVGAVA